MGKSCLGLRVEVLEAAEMGFDGKLTVHPDQISVVNEGFLPSQMEVDESERIVRLLGKRAVVVDKDHMLDKPHFLQATAILEKAKVGIRAESKTLPHYGFPLTRGL